MQNDHVKIASCLFTQVALKRYPSPRTVSIEFSMPSSLNFYEDVMFTFNVFSSTKLSSSQSAANKSSRLAVRGNLDNNISAKIASFFVKRTCSDPK